MKIVYLENLEAFLKVEDEHETGDLMDIIVQESVLDFHGEFLPADLKKLYVLGRKNQEMVLIEGGDFTRYGEGPWILRGKWGEVKKKIKRKYEKRRDDIKMS